MANKYTNIDLTKYANGFQGTDRTIAAEQKKNEAESAVENYGDFNYSRQGVLDSTMNNYANRGPFAYDNEKLYQNAMDANLNREKFTYDLNGDALYQQYKDNYITQGKQAMMDTMGQAAAMTGGYGNSYAATVGNQTYQGHLQKLNNIVPELYKMALDRYNSEGERLAQNFNILAADREMKSGEYNDETARLASVIDVLSSERNFEFNDWSAGLDKLLSNRSYYSDNFNNVYNQEYANWDGKRDFDQTQYWNEYNAGYQAEQDAKANELAQEQLRVQWANHDLSKKKSMFGGFTEQEFVDAIRGASLDGDQKYAEALVKAAGYTDAAWDVYKTYFDDYNAKETALGNGEFKQTISLQEPTFVFDPKTEKWK